MRERDIQRYLVKRVKDLGGEVRKVKWVGRNKAPDNIVFVPAMRRLPGRHASGVLVFVRHPSGPLSALVEIKAPDTILTFPADAHERAQAREHGRLRGVGAHVEVVGTLDDVDRLLA